MSRASIRTPDQGVQGRHCDRVENRCRRRPPGDPRCRARLRGPFAPATTDLLGCGLRRRPIITAFRARTALVGPPGQGQAEEKKARRFRRLLPAGNISASVIVVFGEVREEMCSLFRATDRCFHYGFHGGCQEPLTSHQNRSAHPLRTGRQHSAPFLLSRAPISEHQRIEDQDDEVWARWKPPGTQLLKALSRAGRRRA